MNDSSRYETDHHGQEVIRAKHKKDDSIEFTKEEVEQSIPKRFEGQVSKYAHYTAVKTSRHELTYDDLNKAANHVAQAILAQCGEGAEPVALLLEHGASLLIGSLGVLKAGKICVLLDSDYPRARNAYILEDLQAGLILTDTRNTSLATELSGNSLQTLNVDDANLSFSGENPDISIWPDDLAYVIYTSGSTGQPKGVIYNHRNMLHSVYECTHSYYIQAGDKRTALYSPNFLGGILSMFCFLLNGATFCLFNLEKEGIANLASWLIQEGIAACSSTPTTFRHFVSALTGAERFPELRTISISGEPVRKGDVDIYKQHFSADCTLDIPLGTTESGIICRYRVNKKTQIKDGIVPIGYAVEDAEVSLLDDHGNKVDFGEVGEIVVKSLYLSPGYWRRPDLTAAKFLPDPDGGEERIYHTGDLGIMQPDGCLIHLGRKDFQVKIRGYRVETGEIEAALLNLDGVKEAVVIAGKDQSDDQRLVAYFVPDRQPSPTITALRRTLTETLPDYMIPSAFVVLDAMPINLNNKVDRQALPAPGTARPELETAFVAPRTPVEEALAEIWSQVLGLDEVGVHDNFFELGGHSLMATQIISRVINTLQTELPLRSLFQSPTVSDMALVIIQKQARKVGYEDVKRMLDELKTISDEQA